MHRSGDGKVCPCAIPENKNPAISSIKKCSQPAAARLAKEVEAAVHVHIFSYIKSGLLNIVFMAFNEKGFDIHSRQGWLRGNSRPKASCKEPLVPGGPEVVGARIARSVAGG